MQPSRLLRELYLVAAVRSARGAEQECRNADDNGIISCSMRGGQEILFRRCPRTRHHLRERDSANADSITRIFPDIHKKHGRRKFRYFRCGRCQVPDQFGSDFGAYRPEINCDYGHCTCRAFRGVTVYRERFWNHSTGRHSWQGISYPAPKTGSCNRSGPGTTTR